MQPQTMKEIIINRLELLHAYSQVKENIFRSRQRGVNADVITFFGFKWLINVVFPELSRPITRILASFFDKPNTLASRLNMLILLDGKERVGEKEL